MPHPIASIIGLDVGDTYTHACHLDTTSGQVLEETRVRTTPRSLQRHFDQRPPARVALEVGPHSPWISRLLTSCQHEVLIANPRQVRLIYAGTRKNDKLDAHKLARLARYDPGLLAPIRHRGERAHADLAVIRSRDVLVRTRTGLVNHVRSSVKAFGVRLPSGTTDAFHKRARGVLPACLRPALEPVLLVIAQLAERIRDLDRQIAALATSRYPETELLRRVTGVGPITALAFVLTLEDPARFQSSREVGPYLGLTPGRRQSGDRDPAQRITKQGDALLRRLLVQCAQSILGPRGPACDLKRHGEKIMARGGSYARMKAVTAVARKLAVLLHRLWVTGEVYDPDFNRRRSVGAVAVA